MKLPIRVLLLAAFAVLASRAGVKASQPVDIAAAEASIRDSLKFAETADDYTDRHKAKSRILYSLHLLRDPNPDGKSYQYATVTDKAGTELVLSEALNANRDNLEKQTLVIESSTVTGFQIRSPLQRGFFKNNGDIYLESYKLTYKVNGKTNEVSKVYDNWVVRDTSIPVDVPGLAEWAKLEVVVGVKTADVDRTFIHLYADFPDIQDDPMNPFSYPIGQLKEALSRVENGRRLKEIIPFHKAALEGIAKVPPAIAAAAPAGPVCEAPPASGGDPAGKLKYILYLIEEGGDLGLREAAAELKALIESSR